MITSGAGQETASALWLRFAERIESGIDRLAGSQPLSLLVIAVVTLLCYLPGFFTLPPIDRDEPRFAQASHQMVESGNYLDIRLQDEARYKKPIGIYWMQSASVWLTGLGPDAPIWAYRLPSVLGAVVAACLTWWFGIAFGRPRMALIAGLLMATTLLIGFEARLAKTDAVLLATVIAGHGALVRAWLKQNPSRDWRLAAIFWTAMGLSILVKGPVGPAAVACPLIILSLVSGSFRWFKRLAPLPGFVWMIVIVLPWFVAIGIASHGAFFTEAVGHDLLGKVAGVQESHGAPPGAYVVLFFFTAWPIAAFFLAGLPWIMDRFRHPAILYGLVSVAPFWLAVEAVPTKLPHYVLPLYPLIAIAAAVAIDEGGIPKIGRFSRFARSGAAAFPIGVLALSIAIALLLRQPPSIVGLILFLVAGAVGLVSARLWAISAVASATIAVLAAFITYVGLMGFVMPGLQPLRLSGRLVQAGNAAVTCAKPRFASVGYNEPSLVFLGGTDTDLADPREGATFLAQGGCRVAFVDQRKLAAFNAKASDLGMTVTQHGTVRGYNMNDARFTELSILTGATP